MEFRKGSEGRGFDAFAIQSQHNMLFYSSVAGDFVAEYENRGLTFWDRPDAETFVNAQRNWVLEMPEA